MYIVLYSVLIIRIICKTGHGVIQIGLFNFEIIALYLGSTEKFVEHSFHSAG